MFKWLFSRTIIINNIEYTKNKKIGYGGFSKVYLAHNLSNDKFALKVIKNQHILKKDIINELWIHSKLNHPNIVKYYDSQCIDNNKALGYILMEHCKISYDQLISKTCIRTCEIRKHICMILKGLQYMHSQNIIHGDLKLDNIFISQNDDIKIGDFGLSLYVPHICCDNLNSNKCTTKLFGTMYYLSPEMISHNIKCNTIYGIDIWAVGIIIFYLVFKKFPFIERDNLNQLLTDIVNVDYKFPTNAPNEAVDLIKNILLYDSDERLSIDDMLNHSFLI